MRHLGRSVRGFSFARGSTSFVRGSTSLRRGRFSFAPAMAILAAFAALPCCPSPAAVAATRPARITVGSKAFAESWILGEAVAQLARSGGAATVEHRSNLGGTEIVYQALLGGSVDVYPEYTGTVSEVILGSAERPSLEEMRHALARRGIGISEPLGFDDSYALAVTAATQRKYGLERLSDLARHPDLRLGLTHEFLGRADGYPGLERRYGLAVRNVLGIQHELAYQALAAGKIDVTDIYTTDPQIQRLGLRILEDDRSFFPRYDAVLLYRLDLPSRAPEAWRAITSLAGRVSRERMIRANARVALGRQGFTQAATELLAECFGDSSGATARPAPVGGASAVAVSILHNTLRHLQLVAISLFAAILAGIPLGVMAARSRPLAQFTLSAAGVLQTIPSLALLAFLIPLFGIGAAPALVALFLYGLLPIVRNTYVGLTGVPTALAESAAALGLSPRARLLRVSLPMASPAILAGIKTSAVINVGTATLAALIGAGGLGEPILSGIQLRQDGLILQGAVPAAVLALAVQWAFDLLERVLVPRGLRL